MQLRSILQAISLSLFVSASAPGLAAPTVEAAATAGPSFQSSWRWSRHDRQFGIRIFNIEIEQHGEKVRGILHAYVGKGQRSDDGHFVGIVKGQSATVDFVNSHSKGTGKAYLQLKGGQLNWAVLRAPGAFYYPVKATLKKVPLYKTKRL